MALMQIFLSYTGSEEAYAKSLASQLEKRGFSVWTDAEVLPGDNPWLQTGKALENSRAMVVLLSPDSVRSENVRREIEYALGDPKYEDRLFPVVVRPTRDIPWILRRYMKSDSRQDAAKVSESIANALKEAV